MSLLETLVAASIMLIGISGVMALFMVVAATNMGQGTQATRCTEYAQDKMEQLMALNFLDTSSNTTVLPVQSSGGTGLTIGGYPTAGYVDYITEGSGTGATIYSAQQSSSAYVREWSIAYLASDPTNNTKTITVTVNALTNVGRGIAPTTTIVAMKTNYCASTAVGQGC
jgi:type II secretory pathway pseudopilin PulG